MGPRMEPIGDGWFQIYDAAGRPGVMVGSKADAKKELMAIRDRLAAELAAKGQPSAPIERCECGVVLEGRATCPECGARAPKRSRRSRA